jgi:hypothetical protein
LHKPKKNGGVIGNSDGIYQMIAMISTGEIIDLTPDVLVETSITGETSGGFLPLQ